MSLMHAARAAGYIPLTVQVGDVRLELAPMVTTQPTKLAPPSRDDGKKLLAEYGGPALAALLEDPDMNELEPDA